MSRQKTLKRKFISDKEMWPDNHYRYGGPRFVLIPKPVHELGYMLAAEWGWRVTSIWNTGVYDTLIMAAEHRNRKCLRDQYTREDKEFNAYCGVPAWQLKPSANPLQAVNVELCLMGTTNEFLKTVCRMEGWSVPAFCAYAIERFVLWHAEKEKLPCAGRYVIRSRKAQADPLKQSTGGSCSG